MSDGACLRVDGPVAILTLERPARRNALDEALWHELGRHLDEARAAGPRTLIVTGSGSCFSAGMDLTVTNPIIARLAGSERGCERDTATAILAGLRDVMRRLWEFPAPTIAAVEGACVGGGLEIALGCDIRVAASSAQVCLPEVALGVVPDLGGLSRLSRLVGPGRAALLALSGRAFSAADAERIGIFEQVVNPGCALDEALRLAREISTHAPAAVRSALGVLRRLPDLQMCEALAAEYEAGVAALSGREVQEGLRAHAEGRLPRWAADGS
jgi:enoyl-CoA hydratase/carnithine racemase